jgi:hypothetical protein
MAQRRKKTSVGAAILSENTLKMPSKNPVARPSFITKPKTLSKADENLPKSTSRSKIKPSFSGIQV